MWALSAATTTFPALHMTWGAINEWTTQAGYHRLAGIADHPVLQELLTRIQRQEGRHAGLYASHARALLDDDRKAQRIVRWFLRHFWGPVGSGDVAREETDFVIRLLFADTLGAGYVDRLEAKIDSLPGLAGLGLLRGVVRSAPSGERLLDGGQVVGIADHRDQVVGTGVDVGIETAEQLVA